MANPVKPVPGNKFKVYVGDGATPAETFSFLCVLTTIESQHGSDTDDAMGLDCDAPESPGFRISSVKQLTWDLTGSGLCDPSKAPYQRLRDVYRAGGSVNLQLKKDVTLADGGETEQGEFTIAAWQESSADRGMVRCSFTFHGAGKSAVTPAAA
jgi:hypothetical protein